MWIKLVIYYSGLSNIAILSAMKIIIFSIFLGAVLVQAELDQEAFRECGYLHHLDLRSFPNSSAQFVNSNCALKCTIDGKALSPDPINEGYPCPLDSFGVCHQGKCVSNRTTANSDPLRECGNLHHIDFRSLNNTGTSYENSQCTLRCVIAGTTASLNPVNEGFVCPLNANGICRAGQCQVKQVPTTTIHPNNVTSPVNLSIDNLEVKPISAKLNHYATYINVDLCLKKTRIDRDCLKTCTRYSSTGDKLTNNPDWSTTYSCEWDANFGQYPMLYLVMSGTKSNSNFNFGHAYVDLFSVLKQHYIANNGPLVVTETVPLFMDNLGKNKGGELTMKLTFLVGHN